MQGASNLNPNDNIYPTWGHWDSGSKYLPASFHSRDGFKEVQKALKVPLPEQTYHHMERFALVLWLALRDIGTAVVHADHEVVPDWINQSPLGEKHIQNLLKCCPATIAEKTAVTEAGYVLFIPYLHCEKE